MQQTMPTTWVLLAAAVVVLAGLASVGGLIVLWLTRKRDGEN